MSQNKLFIKVSVCVEKTEPKINNITKDRMSFSLKEKHLLPKTLVVSFSSILSVSRTLALFLNKVVQCGKCRLKIPTRARTFSYCVREMMLCIWPIIKFAAMCCAVTHVLSPLVCTNLKPHLTNTHLLRPVRMPLKLISR